MAPDGRPVQMDYPKFRAEKSYGESITFGFRMERKVRTTSYARNTFSYYWWLVNLSRACNDHLTEK